MAKKYDGFKNQETLSFWFRIQEGSIFSDLKEMVKPFVKKRNDRGFSKFLKERFPNESKKVSFNQVALRFYSKILLEKANEDIIKILMEKERYNGWLNRETWALQLQLTNDEDLYNSILDIKNKTKTMYEFSDLLKDHVMEFERQVLVKSDKKILRLLFDVGSLWRVDFDELAKSFWDN